MMRFWSREIMGWFLVVAGLVCIVATYGLLINERVFEAMVMTPLCIFVFRGGIHLLKVAVAARVCLLVQEQVAAKKPTIGSKPSLVRDQD